MSLECDDCKRTVSGRGEFAARERGGELDCGHLSGYRPIARDKHRARLRNRAEKHAAREIKQRLDTDEKGKFQADAERVQRVVKEEYRDVKRGLVIFCDDSEDFFQHIELNVRVRSVARWDETPYVRPLVELLDEYERSCVALADRERARLFTIYLGEIEEHRATEASADVRHISELLEAAPKHDRAVVKLGATLRAIDEWRVMHLVYADGLTPPGGECVNCGAL